MKIINQNDDFFIKVNEVDAGECFKTRIGNECGYYMMTYQDKTAAKHLRCVNLESGTVVLFNPSDEVFSINIEGVIK